MAVRIQLASNFQVVELTYNSWKDVNVNEVADATTMVNRLGSEVVNEIKTKDNKKVTVVEMATPKQIDCLTRYNKFTREQAESMTKEEARKILMNMVEQSKQKSY